MYALRKHLEPINDLSGNFRNSQSQQEKPLWNNNFPNMEHDRFLVSNPDCFMRKNRKNALSMFGEYRFSLFSVAMLTVADCKKTLKAS